MGYLKYKGYTGSVEYSEVQTRQENHPLRAPCLSPAEEEDLSLSVTFPSLAYLYDFTRGQPPCAMSTGESPRVLLLSHDTTLLDRNAIVWYLND